ncbi:MAG: bifunctional phosphoribosylaminoimidazolecarboxamide formyltransferase/IMP cyclohydrolase [Oscillospiraceae bacterium]|jgi:phosphoribosylaminoimidazolecarboxamide formyltransferase/IMP cyclohydrolase|nr:bifunctional phosphoribosylaminoimidazolecarboxamide formyltransferase/IMP cyclohydrolase [Oscillospiraceae bacterium]
MKKRALFSVSDKSGVVALARRVAAMGYEIISTGGTQSALEAGGVECVNISRITGFPECLDGRLKTLHPVVHGGILAMRRNIDHMAQMELLSIEPIDIVVINLYPFKQTVLREGVLLEEAIENIDIGGPAMLRSAAKNWEDVLVVVCPSDYEYVAEHLEEGTVTPDIRFALAAKVFEHTAHYDALIAEYLRRKTGTDYPDLLTLTFEKHQVLRYGENPHQSAVFYREAGASGGSLALAEQLHGKELSLCNIHDAHGAATLLKEFSEPCAVAVKHANPCGVGVGNTICEAYIRAFEVDPVSIFGGVVALNRLCEKTVAEEMKKTLLDVIIAPGFTDEALEILTAKKNVRLLSLETISEPIGEYAMDLKKVDGGLLVQSIDRAVGTDRQEVTAAVPTESQYRDLDLAWKVCKHVKSNAVVLAKDGRIVGIGPGQVSRVGALEVAIRHAGEKAAGAVAASDAFFPFPDCVHKAHEAGITAIIQPGGSLRDGESVAACNQCGIAMVFTGVRHFSH